MIRSIEQIGQVRPGFSIRDSKTPILNIEPTFGIKPANIKNNQIDFNQIEAYYIANPQKYIISSGDILFPLKKVESVILIDTIDPHIAAVGEWAILTVDRRTIDPKYLLWYWHQPSVEARRLETLISVSNGMKYFKATSFHKFKIHIPSLSEQTHILQLDRQWQEDREQERITKAREEDEFYQQLMNRVIDKSQPQA
jgi:restriction endonuclease S subunit